MIKISNLTSNKNVVIEQQTYVNSSVPQIGYGNILNANSDKFMFLKITFNNLEEYETICKFKLMLYYLGTPGFNKLEFYKFKDTNNTTADLTSKISNFEKSVEQLIIKDVYTESGATEASIEQMEFDLSTFASNVSNQNNSILIAIRNTLPTTTTGATIFTPLESIDTVEKAYAITCPLEGLQSYYKYHDYGLVGCTNSINLLSGKGIGIVNLYNSPSKKMPISVGMIISNHLSPNANLNYLQADLGFKFAYEEFNNLSIVTDVTEKGKLFEKLNTNKPEFSYDDYGIKHNSDYSNNSGIYFCSSDSSYYYKVGSYIHLYDKEDNYKKYLINSNTLLMQQVTNSFGDSITYSWNSGNTLVTSITSSDGETLTINYDSSDKLTSITSSKFNRNMYITSSASKLSVVTKGYIGGNSSNGEEVLENYEINVLNGIITSIVDKITNDKIEFVVDNLKVTTVKQSNDGKYTLKNEYYYGDKYTRVMDFEGKKSYFYFDNFNRVRFITDKNGINQTFCYDVYSYNNVNKYSSNPRLNSHSKNLIENGSFSYLDGWTFTNCSDSTYSIINSNKNCKYLNFNKVGSESPTIQQTIYNVQEGIYNLKGLVNRANTGLVANISIDVYFSTSPNTIGISKSFNGFSKIGEWEQFSLGKFEVPEGASATIVLKIGLTAGSGIIKFDDFKLANIKHFSKTNLIENGYMDFVDSTSSKMKDWLDVNTTHTYSTVTSDVDHPLTLGKYVLKIPSSTNTLTKSVSNVLIRSGISGERYLFGVYGKCCVTSGTIFRSFVRITYESLGVKEYKFNFTPYVSNWQNNINTFITEDNYSLIEVGVEYDGQNEVLLDCFQLYQENTSDSYFYGSKGNTSEILSNGTSTQLMYDKNNKLIRAFESNGNVVSYTYSNGRVSTIFDSCGNRVEYYYTNGHLSKINKLTNSSQSVACTYQLDSDGNITSIVDENESTTTMQYDLFDRMTQMKKGNDGSNIFQYKTNDLMKSVTFQVLDNLSLTNTINYNSKNELTSFVSPNTSYQFSYDQFGRVTSIVLADKTMVTFTYYEKIIDGVTYYTNLIKTETHPNRFTYTYIYDEDNQLTSIQKENETILEYEYDEFGNVIYSKNNQNETVYLYDSNNSLNKVITSYNEVEYISELGKTKKKIYKNGSSSRTVDYFYTDDFKEVTIEGYLGRLCNKFNDEIIIFDEGFKGIYGGECISSSELYCSTYNTLKTRSFEKNTHYAHFDIDSLHKNVNQLEWKELLEKQKTFMAWFKPTGQFGDTNILKFFSGVRGENKKISSSTELLRINVDTDGSVYYQSSTGSKMSLSDSVTLDTWNHIAVKFLPKINNSTLCNMEIFVNGSYQGEFSFNHSIKDIISFKICDASNNTLSSISTGTCLTKVEVLGALVGGYDYSSNEIAEIYTTGKKLLNSTNTIVRTQGIVTYPKKIFNEFEVVSLNGSFESSSGRKPYLQSVVDESYKNSTLKNFIFETDHLVYNATDVVSLNSSKLPSLSYDFEITGKGKIGLRFKVNENTSVYSERTLLNLVDSQKTEILSVEILKSGYLRVLVDQVIVGTIQVNYNTNWHTLLVDFNDHYTNVIVDGSNSLSVESPTNGYRDAIVNVGYSPRTSNYFRGFLEMLVYSDTSYETTSNLLSLSSEFFTNAYPIVINESFDEVGKVVDKNIKVNNRSIPTTYTYELSRIVSESNPHLIISYGYDSTTNRITSISIGDQGSEITNDIVYTYDKAGRLDSCNQSIDSLMTKYEYDKDNISKVRYYNSSNTLLGQATYTYDSVFKNRLLSVTDTYKNKTTTLEYSSNDNEGYPIKINSNSLTWDGKKLKSYGSVNFEYNEQGLRIKKISSGNTYTYLLDGDKVIGINKNGSLLFEFTYDINDQVIGLSYNGSEYFYKRDITGTIIGILDSYDNLVVKYVYSPYGELLHTYSSTTDGNFLAEYNPFLYKGYLYDVETQLFYCNSRYYSPELCRWISPDSIEYLDPESINGLNLYCYCMNNPIMYADPSGCLPQWAEWLIGGAVIGLAALGAVFLPGAAGVIFGAAFYGAVTSAAGGAVLGGILGGITGGWEGFLDGAANGFMWGAIGGAVSGALTSGINIARGSIQIVGSAQKTGSLFHQFASNVQAGKMSLAAGRYSEIHLNRSKGLGIKGFRPDVTGVTKNGLRVVEVVSSSQTYASQVAKVGRMMGQYSHISNGLTLDALRFITSWFVF